jgi:ActR/RegA family two-component response regulator
VTASVTRTRILFVDDEPSIRLTLTAILQQSGFNVTAAATVGEALREINAQRFDALISDLNIGEPGDGFTVVSAMRRTRPECINFILTGYPAFDTALQAIRNQVDDYLVKPANVKELVASLQSKLKSPKATRNFQMQSTANFLREHKAEVLQRTLMAMKSHPRLSVMRLSDAQRTDHVPDFLDEVVLQLKSECPNEPTTAMLNAGGTQGATRRQQGYAQDMLVDDVAVLDLSIYEAVQDRLLDLELSNLVPDLKHVNCALNSFLQESLRAFNKEKAA